ncbi:hypothetical protein BX666DRAFT_310874 [Dichotomocladium elegans]|nr:hypothetical protein BX666DRAFT_310874 [Dichotomocladium elegans]
MHTVDEFIVAGITAKKRIPSALPAAIPSRYPLRARDRRSGSMSSENSLTSQSTITTGVHHYGMTPMIYPSESTTSNSSRSPSRLSDYSAASSQASTNTSGIPRRRPSSGTGSSGLPTPNGSLNTVRRTAGNKGSNEALRSSPRIGSHAITAGQSRLAKRATHVPLPTTRTPPTTLTTTTSRSTGHSSTSRAATADKKGAAETLTTAGASGSRPGSRLGGIRSSHIPAPRKAAASPESPPSRIHARSPTLDPTRHRPQSPLGARRRSSIRSPTPTLGGGNAANSAFGLTSATKSILSQEESRIGRPITKPSGLKPPAAVGGMSHSSSQK